MAAHGKKEKVIVLIIDPQKSFTDLPEGGSLAVDGANSDYENIIKMLEAVRDKIDEIHVSLDTHTLNHIGHPGFWKQTDGTGIPNSIFRLSIDKETNKITGTSIIDNSIITVTPKNPNLNEYVYEYLQWFNTEANTHGQSCFIWFDHCIEGTDGHKVAKILQDKLTDLGNKVKYHIKGQNNLAEMYSIFKAEYPVEENKVYNDEKKKPY